MTKKEEMLQFLHERVFDPVLDSKTASETLKRGVRMTVLHMSRLPADSIIQYFWSAMIGENGTAFGKDMAREGFTTFEDTVREFTDRFSKPKLVVSRG